MARGSHKQRETFDEMASCCADPEMARIFASYRKAREDE